MSQDPEERKRVIQTIKTKLQAKNSVFVSTWEGGFYGIKGSFVSQDTGEIVPVGKYLCTSYDRQILKELEVPIFRGKKRDILLDQFGYMINNSDKCIRKRKDRMSESEKEQYRLREQQLLQHRSSEKTSESDFQKYMREEQIDTTELTKRIRDLFRDECGKEVSVRKDEKRNHIYIYGSSKNENYSMDIHQKETTSDCLHRKYGSNNIMKGYEEIFELVKDKLPHTKSKTEK